MNFLLTITYSWKDKELSFWHHAETPSCKIPIKAMKVSTKLCPWPGCVYWPGMEDDVTDYIKRCLIWINSSNLPIETLHPHEVPPGPWVKAGMDFFQDDFGKKHLIIADNCSKFPIHLPSCIFTSLLNHHLFPRTLHYRRHPHHCDVWQWPSIQWRWLQEVCQRIWLHSYYFITPFPPVKWFHWGNGEESHECLQKNRWFPYSSS